MDQKLVRAKSWNMKERFRIVSQKSHSDELFPPPELSPSEGTRREPFGLNSGQDQGRTTGKDGGDFFL